ncbi:MAG: hypothetical protein ABL907_03145 [Hyphomicrobium sp.]
MVRHSYGIIVSMFGAAFVAPCSSQAHADEFSWMAMLGKSGVSFATSLSKDADCEDLGPVQFDMPTVDDKSVVSPYWTWDRPISGTGFPMVRDVVEARAVRRIKCRVGTTVEATAHVFQDQVFSIAITYPRCDSINGTCDLAEKILDKTVYAAMQVKYAKTDDSAPGQFYVAAYPEYDSDPYLKERLFMGAYCRADQNTNPLFNTGLSERSLIDVSFANGIWHSTTVVELYKKSWFSEAIKARLAACQDFTLVPLDKIAREAFLGEVRTALSIRRSMSAANRARKLRDLKIGGTTR